ncbi:MAG TPA: cytochrome P450 [Sphingobium sp.]|uniref:cytochrome P450 n=1 Tax=Sphingobium sp. TaxID=1912891 RepID=UPI002ED449FD
MTDVEPDFYSDAAIIDDPHGYFDRMRSKGAVTREDYHGSLMVTGYDAVMDVLNRRDDSFSSAPSVIGPLPPLPFQPEGDDIRAQLDAHRADLPWAAHLVCFDGRKHAEHRALLTSLLTYKRLKQNETYLYGLADRMIDRFIDKGRCNVVSDYAHATTTYAISDLMGIPEGDRADLLDLIGAPPSQLDGDAVHKVGPDPLIFLKDRFDGYLRDRLANPGTDLLSELAHSKFRDGSTPDFDALSLLARFLFGAGQDTTSRLIAMAIRILGDRPELQARLRREPERIPDFLEEVLRHDGPVKLSYRLAQRSTTVAGVPAPAGTIVALSLTGASNDPAHFAAPEAFDIDRPHLRDHMAFGKGAHGCLGAPLARLESRIAIERLLSRTTAIRIDESRHGRPGSRHYRYEPTYTFRSLAELHIDFTAR